MKALKINRLIPCTVQTNLNITRSIADQALGYLQNFNVLQSEIETLFLGDVLILTVYAPINQLDFIAEMQNQGLKIYLYRFSYLQSSYVIYMNHKLSESELETAYQKYRFNSGKACFEKWHDLRLLLNQLETRVRF
ncbi:hypothetical protein HYG89_14310 [Acinetobacter sp. SwsAc5]|uniref:hypothetical protein n=1 Tax=Acinetobacter sp. SwsAc5 TaxID=2749438 RepID=UPI0015BE1F8E|nr:hypothetical protein [Acinetobacter sp. SwsAc5]NWK53697.1 hypothetical protein [Acinetobacter sp. SwsAc5]